MRITRGYDFVRGEVTDRPKIYRSCDNCQFYERTDKDESEVCQNYNVLEYDIVVDGNRTYCGYWKSMQTKLRSRRK